MLQYDPDTCSCVADLDTNRLIEKCSIHETFAEMQRHNRTLNLAFDIADSKEKQIESIRIAKRTYFEKIIENPTLIDRFRRIFET